MATIEPRRRSDGTTAYRLKWRYAGKRDGAPQSITHADHDDAKSMKGAVEALRHPVYADDPRVITFELVTGQNPVTCTAPTFGEVAEKYIGSRTRAGAHSRDTYRNTVHNRLSALVNRPIEAVTDDDVRAVLNAITDAGQSATMAYGMACSVFKHAHNKGYVSSNPTLYVDAPKRRGRTANLNEASRAAEKIGDRNDFWLAFGPTNIVIHRVWLALEPGDPSQAISEADRVPYDNLPSELSERRTSHLITVAWEHYLRRKDREALDALDLACANLRTLSVWQPDMSSLQANAHLLAYLSGPARKAEPRRGPRCYDDPTGEWPGVSLCGCQAAVGVGTDSGWR